jgi:hypothetical protein
MDFIGYAPHNIGVVKATATAVVDATSQASATLGGIQHSGTGGMGTSIIFIAIVSVAVLALVVTYTNKRK